MHTGDSVDVGLFIELFDMLDTVSQLEIPFYNAVGNHDILFLGTHGFDLACATPPSDGPLCDEARGYYAFDVPLPPSVTNQPRNLRVLVLNTAEVLPRELLECAYSKSRGEMTELQYLWLQQELAAPRSVETYFIVAGHHWLGGFVSRQNGWLRETLAQSDRVLAYLGDAASAQAVGVAFLRNRRTTTMQMSTIVGLWCDVQLLI